MKPSIIRFYNKLKFEYRITLNYLLFGVLWILFSDLILDVLVPNDALLTQFQTYKGTFFILVTSIFLFVLVRNHMLKLRSAESQLAEIEFRFNRLYEDGPFGMVLADDNFHFKKVNPAFCSMLGYTEEELTQHTFTEITHPDDRVLDLTNIQKLMHKEIRVYRTEKRYLRKDGKIIWGSLTVTSTYNSDGKFLYNLGIIEDITYRKEAQLKINQLNEELEQKVMARTQELTETNHKLNELNATKDKFFSIIAHDLKNPFNIILGYSQLLIKNMDHMDSAVIQKNIKSILKSAENTFVLLQNLLEWSRSQTGRTSYNPQVISLSLLIDTARESTVYMAEQKNITLTTEMDSNVSMFVDKDMINTVIRNLITNAIKFTPVGGTIKLKTQAHDDNVTITVVDTGTGMEKSMVDKLFRINEKVSLPGTNNEPGTGLGLILCKEYIDKHGGSITVESEVGKGSSFTVTIPNL